MKKRFASLFQYPIALALGISVLMMLLFEILGRRSFLAGIVRPFAAPLPFLFGVGMIFLTMLAGILWRRRYAVFFASLFVWTFLLITNFVLLLMRNNPLRAIDFAILRTGIGIIDLYLTPWQLVLIIAAIVIVLGLVVYAFFKLPKAKEADRPLIVKWAIAMILTVALLVLLPFAPAFDDQGADVDEYEEYGFVYAFLHGFLDRGIDTPEVYPDQALLDTIEAIKRAGTSSEPYCSVTPDGSCPNVIYLQLESFFDVNRLQGVDFATNPIPNFSRLKLDYPSGLLTVPSFGSGTGNTEFEVLTGMDLRYFGSGEYPYTSVLREKTCDSVAYQLSSLGYTTAAVHNHTGTFFGRHQIYRNLGFDSFTPLEHMTDVQYNSLGWAKDSMLAREITELLSLSKGRDFIFAVSVQGHGRYPDEVTAEEEATAPESNIEMGDSSNAEKLEAQLNYYIEQLTDMDAFIADLLAQLETFDEPTVVVLYGDHLPGIDFSAFSLAEGFTEGDLYTTDYVIWDNFGLCKGRVGQATTTYRLTADVFELLGYRTPVMTAFHQLYASDENYLQLTELLQYDLLYGHGLAYRDKTPYQPTDMQLGHRTVSISGIFVGDESITVKGKNFTEWSKLMVDSDLQRDTEYVDNETLVISDIAITFGDLISVCQYSDDGVILSESAAFVYKE